MRSQSGPMSQSGGGSGGTVASLAILDAGGDHTITFDTATDEAANRTLTIPALGGNKTIALIDLAQTFTAQQVFETGAAGASPVIFRQTGGVAGTDDTEVTHTGTLGSVTSKSGNLNLVCTEGGITFALNTAGNAVLNGSGLLQGPNLLAATAIYVGAALDTTLTRVADGVVKFAGSSGAQVELPQSADVGTPSSNSARIGSEDVAGTAEMIVSDEAGTETQISEHRSDGPNWLYDDVAATGMLDRIEYERQRYLGAHRYFNVSRFRRLMAAGTPITSAPGLPTTCEFVETFAQWHIRCPEKAAIQKRDWETDQAAKQVKYDADRQAELDRVAEIQAAHAKALSDYAKLPAAEKAKKPAPVAPLLPTVRPAKNVKKPKPSWIK